MKEKFDVTGMTCSACSAHVEKSVRALSEMCIRDSLYHVDDGTQPSPSLEEGAYIQKVMERAYESDAKGGAWVSID